VAQPGRGKTTTLAALVDIINRRDRKHVITIEDPIEYEHAHQASIVEQIEVGTDCPDFPTALRHVVRQAPDVLVLGEMRDPETMKTALAAAETGHLVLSTLHTTDVTSTIGRIADSFPAERQPTIRQELAMALTAVLTQQLVPSPRGDRVPACELLIVGYGARQHIRKNALQHLHQEITITRRHGSFTLEEHLQRLVASGAVAREDALSRARHVEELERLLR
jgi:twitching motility protein PilT